MKAPELITGWNSGWRNNSIEEFDENAYESGAPMNVGSLVRPQPGVMRRFVRR